MCCELYFVDVSSLHIYIYIHIHYLGGFPFSIQRLVAKNAVIPIKPDSVVARQGYVRVISACLCLSTPIVFFFSIPLRDWHSLCRPFFIVRDGGVGVLGWR